MFSRKSSKVPYEDEDAPPAYETDSSTAQSDSKSEIVDEIKPLEISRVPSARKDIRLGFVVGEGDARRYFRFSLAKLEQRDCTGLRFLLKELVLTRKREELEGREGGKAAEEISEFNAKHTETWGPILEHSMGPAAMKLLEEWVDTRELRPLIKHKSSGA